MKNVDFDWNSWFHWTYSFDTWKLLLTNIGSNQKDTLKTIQNLEEEIEKLKLRNDELEGKVLQNQATNDKKFKTIESVLNSRNKKGDPSGGANRQDERREVTQKPKKGGSKEDDNHGKRVTDNKQNDEKSKQDSMKIVSDQNEKEQTKTEEKKMEDSSKEKDGIQRDKPSEDGRNNQEHSEASGEKGSEQKENQNINNQSNENRDDNDENYENGGEPVFFAENADIDELKSRVFDIERKLKNMELSRFSKSTGGSSEDWELQKAGWKTWNERVDGIKEISDDHSKKLEEIALKVNDFNIYDLFKDCTSEGGNIDVSKLWIMNLESKVFKKFELVDEKQKKADEELYKAKNDLINLKNQNEVTNRAFNNVKDDIKKLAEELLSANDDTSNKVSELERKVNENFKKLSNNDEENLAIITKKHEALNDKVNKWKEKVENMKTGGDNSEKASWSETDLRFWKELNKKIEAWEKNLKAVQQAANWDQVKADIKSIMDQLLIKSNQQDVYDINDKVNAHTASISLIKDNMEHIGDEASKALNDVNFLLKKLENMNVILTILKEKEENAANNRVTLFDPTKFVDNNTFNEFQKEYNKYQDKVQRDFDEIRRYWDELTELLKTKATDEDLRNWEGVIMAKIEEVRVIANKRFADKIDTSKSIKYWDTQLKHIIDVYIKKMDKGENWLLAKKPIGGFNCASCEAYIGELQDNKKDYLAWNKYPMREPQDKAYRIGNGFSRMWNMLNLDVKNSYENSGNMNEQQYESDGEMRHTSAKGQMQGKNGQELPNIKQHSNFNQNSMQNDVMNRSADNWGNVDDSKGNDPNQPHV